MRFFTGKGDSGETDTVGFGRVGKESPLAKLLGDIDELNSFIGVAITEMTDNHVTMILKKLQNKLFAAGADAASNTSNKSARRITTGDVRWVEEELEGISVSLPELKKFVLPGGSVSAAYLHLARSVARRAERSAVSLSKSQQLNPQLLAFLNRCSSLLFACALYMNRKEGIEESNPSY